MSAAPQLKQAFKFKVNFQRGPLTGQSFVFDKAQIQIGRGTENDLVLANDLRASRHHAEIKWDGSHLKIVNGSSKNFIVINGSQEDSATLSNGDIILIGESEFRIEFDATQLSISAQSSSQKSLKSGAEVDEPKTRLVVAEAPPVAAPSLLQQTGPAPITPAPHFGSVPTPMSAPIPNMHHSAAASKPRRSGPPKTRSSNGSPLSDPKIRFWVIVVAIGLVGYWLMSSSNAKKKELSFRSSEQIERDIEASREEIKEFEARKDKLDNVQFRRAQENYIRGFRDYKQGNYGRARESFQVVLNLDPDNELAKRYYHLSKVKFDEMVKFHMLQGNRYREKKNWRMCRSSYFNVMTMVNNNQDPLFKEAKQYFEQCTLAQQGTY